MSAAKQPPLPVTSLDDPRIGIEDPLLAELVYATYSRLAGKMGGWRANLDRYSRLLSGTALVAVPGSKHMDALPPLVPGLKPLGWPDAKHTLRKRGLEPGDLDRIWSRSLELEGEECFARIELELLTALLPVELFRPFALMIAEGPRPTARRFERWMRLVARGDAPCGSPLNENSLKIMRSAFQRLLVHLKWHLGMDPEMEELAMRWETLPPLLDIATLKPSRKKRDTSAIPRREARRAYYTLVKTVNDRRSENHWDDHLNQLKPLRNLTLLGTLTSLAPRLETVATMTVLPQLREDGTYRTSGYIPEYECPWDHEVRPALLFANLKGRRDDFVVKAMHPELAKAYETYLGYAGIRELGAHPMWVSEWEYIDKVTGERVPRIRYQYAIREGRYVPRAKAGLGLTDDGILNVMATILGDFTARDNPHAARKLAFQLAPEAAAIHLAERGKGPFHLLREFTPGHILLDHTLASLASIYGDIAEINAPNRQEVSFVVGSMIWEMLYGDRGATMGLDIEAIRSARDVLHLAETQLSESTASADVLTAEICRLHAEEHPAQSQLVEVRTELRELRSEALEQRVALTETEFQRSVFLSQELDDQRDSTLRLERSLVERRDEERCNATRLTHALGEARRALDAAVAARVPLPEPVCHVPDLDAELRTLLDERPPAPAPDDALLVRRLVTFVEYAEVMKIKKNTLRAQVWEANKAGQDLRFPDGDPRAVWFQPLSEILVSHGPWRFFNWDALDKSKYNRIQLDEFRTILSRPMTGRKWINAAAALHEAELAA